MLMLRKYVEVLARVGSGIPGGQLLGSGFDLC